MSSSELINLLNDWQQRRVVVAGDFMLDRYAYGDAERLSPDAPVPVLAIQRQQDAPGGAANVCLDLRALGCQVSTLGALGDDEPGRILSDKLAQAGCDTAGLVTLQGRPTTVKHNFVGLAQHRHPQKMFRVDHECCDPLTDEQNAALLEQADALLQDADVLCIEDYNKGALSDALCQGLIERATTRGIPVLVDPAGSGDYRKYRGASAITPNRTEAERATGHRDMGDDQQAIAAMGRQLLENLALEAVVLTLDKQGAMLVRADEPPRLIPTRARQVYDVTGAGDMVLAMLAGALANGASWSQAVALANTAAGLEVEQFGVVPIPLDQIMLAVLAQDAEAGKQRSLEHVLAELQAHRRQGKRIGFTNGCFDILHAGHVQYLRQAAEQADLLVVGLNSDASIRRLKGQGRPVNQQADRVLVMSELQSVDYVVVFEQDTPMQLLEAIRPDVLVKGADYTPEQVVGRDLVQSYGGQVVLVPLVEGRSTSNIIRTMREADV